MLEVTVLEVTVLEVIVLQVTVLLSVQLTTVNSTRKRDGCSHGLVGITITLSPMLQYAIVNPTLKSGVVNMRLLCRSNNSYNNRSNVPLLLSYRALDV